MKQTKMYEAPKMEVIEVEPQGILCTSGGFEPTGFNGRVMELSTTTGVW